MKTRAGFLIGLLILSISQVSMAEPRPKKDGGKLPLCESAQGILQNKGKIVKLVGTYKYSDAGKCWVAKVELRDTSVVIRYQPALEEVEKFNNKTVMVVGKVTLSSPPGQRGQALLAFHLTNIQSIEEYTPPSVSP